MAEQSEPTDKVVPCKNGWPIYEVWKQYEQITMHFNDLLMRIRTQALGAVAALATIVGIFAKSSDAAASWELVAFAFFFLTFFWIAIWAIDTFYYNKLLVGAVVAVMDLEKLSKDKLYVQEIDISTKIEAAVSGGLSPDNFRQTAFRSRGRVAFYSIVFLALVSGFVFSFCKYANTPVSPKRSASIETPFPTSWKRPVPLHVAV
jgi:hypothetical protein